MKNGEKLSCEQIQSFMNASGEFRFEASNREELYEWVCSTLEEHKYNRASRQDKGLLRNYIAKMTGLSRAQVTRLIGRYKATGEVKQLVYKRYRFPRLYTPVDIELLVVVDQAHETLSGPATQKILHREYYEYSQEKYIRLAAISVPHIYNLRKSRIYREKQIRYTKTRATKVAIGERRRPAPDGRPGYLRIDTVHQGDLDGVKGVYHINAVDEVTQWEVVGAVAQISEAWLIPVLERMLAQFPFRILGFHTDNGSEFINHRVAALLNKLLAEQTKSRPRHSNDNGLVETKNGAVVRKHMGYGHIESKHADEINEFYETIFNPYLNFHRPCGVPETVTNDKGKQRRIYRWYATPLEILRQLPDIARYLKPGQTLVALEKLAKAESDTESAKKMQRAKQELFAGFQQRRSA